MQCTTKRRDLLELLGKLRGVASARCSLPICNSILLRAGKGKLSAYAYNLEEGLTGSCEAKVAKGGDVCVPLSIMDVLKAVSADEVTLTRIGKRQVKVEAGNTTSTMEGYEGQDFPPLPAVKGKPVVVEGLAEALNQVSFAMATEDRRPVLKAVCFTPLKGEIELAAADGFRLAITKVKASGTLPERVNVPFAAVKLIEKMKGAVTIRAESTTTEAGEHSITNWDLSFESDGLVMVVRAIAGNFPDYTKLIPTKKGNVLKVAREELQDAVKMLSSLKPDSGIIRLKTVGKRLVVSAKDKNEAVTEVKVAAQGKAKSAFNDRYLLDMLSRAEEVFELRQESPSTPGVVKTKIATHVLMPMFVQW